MLNIYDNAPKHDILIIDMSKVSKIDLSGVYTLEDLIKNAKAKDIKVFVSSADADVKKILENVDFIKNIGVDNYKDSIDSTVSAISEFSGINE